MGVLVTADDERAGALRAQRSRTGATAGALESFLALRGLRTLDVRLRRQEDNAGELAARLAAHPAVERVRYPGRPEDPHFERAQRLMDGPGAMLAFELEGGAAAADRLCERVELITHATSLGGVESLIERRARYAGERSIGTPAGLVRFSVGIEDVDDLWSDLDQAL
jgi:cystathionine gamma-synthase